MDSSDSSVKILWEKVKNLLLLKLEYTKLTLAEKLTVLMAMAALFMVGLFIVMIVIFFMSVALSQWLGSELGTAWGSLIVAGIYLVLLLLLYALRRQIFFNPIAKFITKLFH